MLSTQHINLSQSLNFLKVIITRFSIAALIGRLLQRLPVSKPENSEFLAWIHSWLAYTHLSFTNRPWFIIPLPSSASLYPAHPSQWNSFFILESSSWLPSCSPCPYSCGLWGPSVMHKAQPFTPLLPWHWTCVTATGDPSDEKKGLCLSQGAHCPALVSAASGSQWAFIGFLNCICLVTAFACLHSSLLVSTHIENEGVNTLTWVITLRLLFFFLSFPSSGPQNKRINSKRIK